MRKGTAVIILALLLAMGGVAKSLFTDSAVSKGNRITSGELAVGISKDGKRFYREVRLFSLENIVPGDERSVSFYIKNRGTVDAKRLSLTLLVRNYEVKMSPAEEEVDPTPERGELGKWLVLRSIKIGNRTVELNKTLNELNGTEIVLPKTLKPGETTKVELTLVLPAEAGNECQTDGIDVTLRIDASQ
ncbi:TasA family protein [Thermococcus sp.]|uniref:TasA family protein n=1 Tax=Thermococcus sp. TaxID=35749 RepID=UPI002635D565|nr:TasA family protein [Thermococcus sp.]